MPNITPELRAAIDTAKERIKVDSYYTKAMASGVRGNAQGFWSGTVIGFFTGGLAGGLISLGLAVAAPGLSMIGLPLILGIAGIGGTAGGINGARIGAQSGSIAGVAAERERRDKAEQLEKEIVSSPAKQQEVIQAYRANPVVEKNDTVEGINATSRTGSEALGKIINWKTTVATVAICTVVSIALFSGAWVLGGGSLLGGTVATAIPLGLGNVGVSSVGGMLAVAIGAGAAMGVAFATNFPAMVGSLSQKTADLLSRKNGAW